MTDATSLREAIARVKSIEQLIESLARTEPATHDEIAQRLQTACAIVEKEQAIGLIGIARRRMHRKH